MKYKAVIFDKLQYLYSVTGFSDHQVHCIISFDNNVDASIMRKSVELLVKAVPILSRIYKNHGGNSFWEDADTTDWDDLFTIVNNKEDFDRFTVSKTNEATGPQIKVCLLQADHDSLSILINHMVSDGAGFKQCIYQLSDIYSHLIRNPDYVPDYIIDGDRSFKSIVGKISLLKKTKVLLLGSKDNNQSSGYEFQFSKTEEQTPFIVTHEIAPLMYKEICNYCKNNNVTVNDVILTAYFRAISGMLNLYGKELTIPIMIDMRRYMKDKSFYALTNLASTAIVNISVLQNEDFSHTLHKVSSDMNAKKANNLGLNTFLKLDTGFKIPILNVYEILRKSLNNPKISITNIGVLDSSKLVFENSAVVNVVMCASVKYRPYFQMTVSTFNDKMTFSAGLYGKPSDRDNIKKFFNKMEYELMSLSKHENEPCL